MIKPYYKFGNFILLTIFCSLVNGSDNTKLAQTGFQFLSVTSDARAGGMGDAMTTFHANSAALFFNPAGMSRQKSFIDLSFSQNQWIADINHNALSLSVTPANGKYGVIGMSFVHVDYGELQGTMVWDNEQGFLDTEIIKPSALALGLGYAKALSDKFSVRGQIKSAYQYLGKSIIPDSDTSQAVMKMWPMQLHLILALYIIPAGKVLLLGCPSGIFHKRSSFKQKGSSYRYYLQLGYQ